MTILRFAELTDPRTRVLIDQLSRTVYGNQIPRR